MQQPAPDKGHHWVMGHMTKSSPCTTHRSGWCRKDDWISILCRPPWILAIHSLLAIIWLVILCIYSKQTTSYAVASHSVTGHWHQHLWGKWHGCSLKGVTVAWGRLLLIISRTIIFLLNQLQCQSKLWLSGQIWWHCSSLTMWDFQVGDQWRWWFQQHQEPFAKKITTYYYLYDFSLLLPVTAGNITIHYFTLK